MNILFDLDGTLLDTAHDFFYALNQLRTENDLPILSNNVLNAIRIAVSGGVLEVIKSGFDPSLSLSEQNILSDRFLDIYQELSRSQSHAILFPGMIDLLKTLKERKIPWGIVTNKHSAFTLPLLKQLPPLEEAMCVVCGDTTPNPKPHPDPLLYACKKLNTAPNQCVYVGDAERDIIAGKKAGMKTIAALFGYIDTIENAKAWNADHYVHHVNEILPWVEQYINV